MHKFWELLERSIIVQSIITLALVGTVITLYLTDRDVPGQLWLLVDFTVGFWMGTKVEHTIQTRNSGSR